MSENRFGFNRPTTVTTSTTRTSRIPGTNVTRTDTHTTVTELNQCPSFPQQQGGTPTVTPTGLPMPRGIPQRVASGPSRSGVAPESGPRLQPPRTLPRPYQPAQNVSVPAGPAPASRQTGQPGPARGLPAPRALFRPPAQGLPQPRPPAVPQGPPQRTATARSSPPITSTPRLPQSRLPATPQGLPQRLTSTRLPAPGTSTPGLPQSRLPAVSQRTPSAGLRMPMPSRSGPGPSQLARQAPAQSQNEQIVHEQLMNKTAERPKEKVTVKGKSISSGPPQTIQTPMGPEQVLQKAVLEKRVERDATGETIIKNLSVADFDEATGQMQQVELGVQQLDPLRPMDMGREVIGVTSTVSVSASHTTVEKEAIRMITQPLDGGIDMDPAEVAQLVAEEKEDVENTLKMMPPDLELTPGRYELKSRLQQMRLNSESMALLEQSIIQPEPTADEVHTDPSPEAMAIVMHTVETGVTPQAAPDEVFNSLFTETTDEHFVKLSSVTPGPLQDVVVPTEEMPSQVHNELLSFEMNLLADRLDGIPEAEYIPKTDIFAQVMEDAKKTPTKGMNKAKPFPMIENERSLWVNANLEHLVYIVGAEPAEVVDPYNLGSLEESGQLEKEMANGMDYIVDSDPVQYVSRVQLRGTELPNYFPGYLVALPDFPETVRIARSPDEVFASAWKSVQPKYFAEESLHSASF